MEAILNDTVEEMLDELLGETPTPLPEPQPPLQNALPESRPSISVIVAAESCSKELLRILALLNDARTRLGQGLERKTEILVAVYGKEATESPSTVDSVTIDDLVSPSSSSCFQKPNSVGKFASAEEFDARVVPGAFREYASGINAAAGLARGRVLIFLNHNLMPKRDCLSHIYRTMCNRKVLGGVTNVTSDAKGLGSKLASLVLRIPLSLKGVSLGIIFVRRSVFVKLKGFEEVPSKGETIEFILRLKKHAATTRRQFSNIKAICATRYGKGAFALSLREWLMLLGLPYTTQR